MAVNRAARASECELAVAAARRHSNRRRRLILRAAETDAAAALSEEASELARPSISKHERSRIAAELAQTKHQLEDALTTQNRMAGDLATNHGNLGKQREHIEALLAALPPDPRGGVIAIRAADFKVNGDKLGYDMVFTRTEAKGAPFSGVMQLHVAGKTAGGTETTVAGSSHGQGFSTYEIAHGSLPMPAGFVPRQITIRLLDRLGDRVGMRVLNVN